MSGTPGPGYVAQEKDTEAVTGNTGAAATGTQNRASNVDTSNTGGGSRKVEPKSPAVTEPDTSGTNSSNSARFTPTSTAMHGTVNTLNSGSGYGVPEVNQPYRAPGKTPAASNKDTTRTDVQPGGSKTNPVPSSQNIGPNISSYDIGAAGSGHGVQPGKPAKPTVATGPRFVTVTWVKVADPTGDKVQDYVIENDRTGTTYAGANETSHKITYLDPSQTYKFRVAARNRGGLSAFSPWSDPVRPYNPDAPDVLAPGGLTAANKVNPIYGPDGSVKAGTGLGPA